MERILKILLVDDEEQVRGVVSQLLGLCRPDYQVHEARNGSEALEMVRREASRGNPYDVVLTDTGSAPIDGATLAATIGEQVPVILITGALPTISQGVREVVEKPFNSAKLFSAISRATSQKK